MKRGSRKMKREKGGEDRLSDLPDAILLHIMSFLTIREVVQICILSKRWKNLWKCIPDITLHNSDFSKYSVFYEFVSGFAACLDGNYPLNSLYFSRHGCFPSQILTNLLRYAVSHEIRKLRIYVPYNVRLPSFVFSCQSLTSLDISVSSYDIKRRTRIPKSIQLPSLVSLRIESAAFTTDENGDAEPFSTCTKLNTLTIDHLVLLGPNWDEEKEVAVALIISNAKLANLTINDCSGHYIEISTPNLSSFTFNGSPFQKLRGQEGINIELRSSSLA